jgi:ribonuclease HII
MEIICGLDECGRGPLAGPIVAAGVILPENFDTSELRDSKKLPAHQRETLSQKIIQSGAIVAIEKVSVKKINAKGIGWANKEVFRKLILKLEAQEYIVDGKLKIKVRGKTPKIRSEIKADDRFPPVMAASIIAKVWRDALMDKLHRKNSKYSWNANKGYGTKAHISALVQYGSSKHHRELFIATALQETK